MIDYPRNPEGWPSDWFIISSILVGQADGEVFIPDVAIAALEKTQLTITRDDAKGGYVVRLEPNRVDQPGAHIDGSND